MRKDIDNKYSTCTTCLSSGRNLPTNYCRPEKIELPVLTEPGLEIQIKFLGELYNKQVTSEPYILIGNDPYSNWPVNRLGESTDAGEVIIFLQKIINLYRIPNKWNQTRLVLSNPKTTQSFMRTKLSKQINVQWGYLPAQKRSNVQYKL